MPGFGFRVSEVAYFGVRLSGFCKSTSWGPHLKSEFLQHATIRNSLVIFPPHPRIVFNPPWTCTPPPLPPPLPSLAPPLAWVPLPYRGAHAQTDGPLFSRFRRARLCILQLVSDCMHMRMLDLASSQLRMETVKHLASSKLRVRVINLLSSHTLLRP